MNNRKFKRLAFLMFKCMYKHDLKANDAFKVQGQYVSYGDTNFIMMWMEKV